MLRDFDFITGDRLIWQQPKFGVDYFQLRVGSEHLAEISWTEWFSDRATARTSKAGWIFDRLGFFRRSIQVIEDATGVEVARIELNWWESGQISCASGAEFAWQKTGFWGDTWVLSRKNGPKLFEFWFGMHWFKRAGEVVLASGARLVPELPLLVCLGWYLATCDAQDASGAIAAGGSVAAVI